MNRPSAGYVAYDSSTGKILGFVFGPPHSERPTIEDDGNGVGFVAVDEGVYKGMENEVYVVNGQLTTRPTLGNTFFIEDSVHVSNDYVARGLPEGSTVKVACLSAPESGVHVFELSGSVEVDSDGIVEIAFDYPGKYVLSVENFPFKEVRKEILVYDY